jgi:hypothetical protein
LGFQEKLRLRITSPVFLEEFQPQPHLAVSKFMIGNLVAAAFPIIGLAGNAVSAPRLRAEHVSSTSRQLGDEKPDFFFHLHHR